MAKKLTAKQKRFADEWLIDFDATRSYKVAYPNCKKDETAAAAGARLLRNVKVAEYIEKRMRDREKRTEISQDRVLKEYARLGFFDPRKLFNEDGSPKSIVELDDDIAAAIAGLDVIEIWEGKGEDRHFVGYLKKYKLADKKGALDSVARHLGMFNDKIELNGNINHDVEIFIGPDEYET